MIQLGFGVQSHYTASDDPAVATGTTLHLFCYERRAFF